MTQCNLETKYQSIVDLLFDPAFLHSFWREKGVIGNIVENFPKGGLSEAKSRKDYDGAVFAIDFSHGSSGT